MKHFHYTERGLQDVRSALLTIWPTLNRYHDDLVLVGGLAVDCLTDAKKSRLPGSVTTDVDNPSRLVRKFEEANLYLDFLTESSAGITGVVTVDDVVANVVPGINRALECKRWVEVTGEDFYGSKQSMKIAVADIGPLLVLKINAFGGPTGRRHAKDAYDVLLAVTAFMDGAPEAIRLFHEEAKFNSQAYVYAIEALKRDFLSPDSAAPVRAASFLEASGDERDRIREEVVTVGNYLLNM